MSYLNSVTIVRFVRATRSSFKRGTTVRSSPFFPSPQQRSWKNAEDEWVSKVEWHRVTIFRPRLAEAVLNNIKKGAHVLVEGSLNQLDLRAGEWQMFA